MTANQTFNFCIKARIALTSAAAPDFWLPTIDETSFPYLLYFTNDVSFTFAL